jgi:hypothetical protein
MKPRGLFTMDEWALTKLFASACRRARVASPQIHAAVMDASIQWYRQEKADAIRNKGNA